MLISMLESTFYAMKWIHDVEYGSDFFGLLEIIV